MRFVLIPVFAVLLFSCTTILRTREEVRIPERTVALTFDDGPSETAFVDERLLDLLQEKHLKECFCLLTSKVPGKGPYSRASLPKGTPSRFTLGTTSSRTRSPSTISKANWPSFEPAAAVSCSIAEASCSLGRPRGTRPTSGPRRSAPGFLAPYGSSSKVSRNRGFGLSEWTNSISEPNPGCPWSHPLLRQRAWGAR